jgi:hypothetical protein
MSPHSDTSSHWNKRSCKHVTPLWHLLFQWEDVSEWGDMFTWSLISVRGCVRVGGHVYMISCFSERMCQSGGTCLHDLLFQWEDMSECGDMFTWSLVSVRGYVRVGWHVYMISCFKYPLTETRDHVNMSPHSDISSHWNKRSCKHVTPLWHILSLKQEIM